MEVSFFYPLFCFFVFFPFSFLRRISPYKVFDPQKLSPLLRVVSFLTTMSFFAFSVMKCAEEADLVFVLDTSGSITDENFEKQKNFVKALASSFDPAATSHQLALMSYSGDAQIEVTFKNKTIQKDFEKAIDRVSHSKGRTRLDKALQLASSQLFAASGGSRPSVRKVMIVLTDGRQSQDFDTVPLSVAVRPLRQLGVKIYAVAIGDEVDLGELNQITDSRDDVISVSDFDDLANMASDVASKSCRVVALSPGK